jgi:hypothetical protein
MTRFGSGRSGPAVSRRARLGSSFIFHSEELNLVLANWQGRGFSVSDDGPGLAECGCHHQPFVVRRRLPAPRASVVFDINLSVTRHTL